MRNLWLLMLYASDLYREKGAGQFRVEDNPDRIPDLVAEILCRVVEKRLARNLTCGYVAKREVMNRVRGRIDLLYTERHRLPAQGKVACHFQELTVDTPRNRFVRAALDEIARIVASYDLARRCRSLAACLRSMGVNGRHPGRRFAAAERFGLHDRADRRMVAAAQLAFELALPTEAAGQRQLSLPDREDECWVRRLFEKAVAGFYDVVLSPRGWRVSSGKHHNWPVERKTPDIDRIMPSMKTDIILEHQAGGRRLIIDTKFTSIITSGYHRAESLRSGYLYQIYAYIRTQEHSSDPLSVSASGILLHPAVDDDYDESVFMQGHEFRFVTVDLAAEAPEIRRQLLRVAGLEDA